MSKKAELQKQPRVSDEAISLAEQWDQLHDLKALYDSEGGKQLVSLLLQDISSAVTNVAANRRMYTLQDFQSLASDIDTKLNLVRLLTRAEENERFVEEQIQESLT